MEVKVKVIKAGAQLPYRATQGSVGADLYAFLGEEEDMVIKPGERKLVPTGIAIEIPEGYGAFVFPRSSLGVRYGVTLPNCVGVVDWDYRGEICVPLVNNGDKDFTVQNRDRVAQLVLIPVETAEFNVVDTLSDTQRGIGGFGSTGRS